MGDDAVPKAAEEQLRSKLKSRALRKCDELTAVRETNSCAQGCGSPLTRPECDVASTGLQAMVECSRDKLFSVVWACREHLNALNECTRQWTGDDQLEDIKARWVKAGRPSNWRWNPWPEEESEIQEFEERKMQRLRKRTQSVPAQGRGESM